MSVGLSSHSDQCFTFFYFTYGSQSVFVSLRCVFFFPSEGLAGFLVYGFVLGLLLASSTSCSLLLKPYLDARSLVYQPSEIDTLARLFVKISENELLLNLRS